MAPTPTLLPKLCELLRDPNANVEEIQAIITCDGNLVVGILKLCNSPYYRGTDPVLTVEDAVLRLGFNATVEKIITLATQELYALPPEADSCLAGLWDHSLLTGIMCRRLAQHREGMAGLGFTAGLLHDIGKVILIKAAPQQYSQILDRAKRRHKACVDQEEEDWGTNHANIGAEVLARWKIPSDIINAIWFHHHPGLSGTEHPMSCCIELADSLSYAVGHGMQDQYTRHRETRWLLEELNLTRHEIADILKESLVEMDELKNVFSNDTAVSA